MRIGEVEYSSHFRRALKKLPANLKSEVRKRDKIFRQNCFAPKLKTHKLSGKLAKYWSFSITHSHRVLFEFSGKGKVTFIDVDDHSIYK